MDNNHSAIKIFIVVPYFRTFQVIVNIKQKIGIIKKAFPNIKNQKDLLYWFDGSKLMPHLTFQEVGIHENSTIVISIETDQIVLNQFFVFISKYVNEDKMRDKLIQNFSHENIKSSEPIFQCLPNDQTFKKEKNKYIFIQKLKELYSKFNFSRNQDSVTKTENSPTVFNTSPLPLIT
ncbi:hypothetical protein M9Y10_024286 [Tritrichomonas musculus]|uniref:Ubiquitin-like domain-containing protein n=1 Tax=Tritrichomonas musculus TaxID=1915356 RepID=A0ABR2HCL3_9EUKA